MIALNKKLLILSFLLLIIDQTSKYLIEFFLSNKIITIIPNFWHISFTYNEGGAFSILEGHLLLLIIGTILCLILLESIRKDMPKDKINIIIFSLLYGGIFGNLIDRLLIGKVKDFLDFQFGNYHFPTFNLADTWIVLGIFFLIIKLLKKERKS